MQYIVTGLDGRDQDAAQRRLDARQAHLASAEAMKANGSLLFASAILSEQEAMIGSIMIVDFADRAALDAWLDYEPYIKGKVWQEVKVEPCRVAPMFAKH